MGGCQTTERLLPNALYSVLCNRFTHLLDDGDKSFLVPRDAAGGAAAVGSYAVRLASHAGATVIATASGHDEAYLKSIGASRAGQCPLLMTAR